MRSEEKSMKTGFSSLSRARVHARPICFSSSYSSSLPSLKSTTQPQTPLFLRPPTYSTTISDLRKWYEWAKGLASSVGSSFVKSDNGPDSTLLCRELNWLLEDSVAAEEEDPSFVFSSLYRYSNGNDNLRLKTALDNLYCLWKQRIEERRPFQYIVGCEHWRDLVLSVEEGVLIPRPETELMVDLVADAVLNNLKKNNNSNWTLEHGLWADLGTGSGAIAIGIARLLRVHGEVKVIATDLSPLAVSVATFNVHRYGLQDMIEVRQGSWFEPLMDVEGKLAGIISNPPYIPSNHISNLQAEVARHEPRLALDGGRSGMDYLLHLCNGAVTMLKTGGFFVVETNGEEQCKFLASYMQNDLSGSFCNVNVVSDFAGIPRFVTAFCQ